MGWIPSDIDIETRASLEERINLLAKKLTELERRLKRLEEQTNSIFSNSSEFKSDDEIIIEPKGKRSGRRIIRESKKKSKPKTIQLTYEEFEHVASHRPGTCGCEVCRRFWSAVREWINEIEK